MQRLFILIYMSIFLAGGLICSLPFSRADISASERAVLIALYNSTGGSNWKDDSGWKEPPLDDDGFSMPGTECDWFGVTCSADGKRITTELLLPKGGEA